MICPICDASLLMDEVLMLTNNNEVNHCYWDMDGQTWATIHISKPDEYQVSINFGKG